jgi:hypothetical protein
MIKLFERLTVVLVVDVVADEPSGGAANQHV